MTGELILCGEACVLRIIKSLTEVLCVRQRQRGEQPRRPGHGDGYGISPEPPQRAGERESAEESSGNGT